MKTLIIFLVGTFLLTNSLEAQKNKYKVGKKAPVFELDNHDETFVDSKELLEKNEGIIVFFYMGTWNKYDIQYLELMQSIYPQIKSKKYQVVAITREKIRYTKELVSNREIEFLICRDADWRTMSQFGVANQISPRYLPDKHKEFSRLNTLHSGSKDGVIPIPATYIVGKDGKVKWTHFDIDYRRRPSTEDILNNL